MRHERLFNYHIKFRVYGFYVAGTFKTYQTEYRKNNCRAFIFSLSRVGNSSLSGRPPPAATTAHSTTLQPHSPFGFCFDDARAGAAPF